MTFLLNTGRTVTQGRFVEHKYTPGYTEETSSCFMNPLDLMELDIMEGECVMVNSEWGRVVLRTVACEEVSQGTVFVPIGPFANHIITSGTHSTGMPDFKNIRVTIEPTDEHPIAAWDLMEAIGGKRYEGK